MVLKKKILILGIAFLAMIVFVSCEGSEMGKEVEKSADNRVVAVREDSTAQKLSKQVVDDGQAWLGKHVEESLKKNVTDATASRTVKRMDVVFSKESAGNAVYLVTGNMQNGTEFSYEFHLVPEGKDFKIASTDAPKYF